MSLKRACLGFLLLLTLFSASACTGVDEHSVYVTVYPLQYVAERILSDTPMTVGIVPGVTSHSSSVDWSPKEIIAMTKADYLFYVGANYDQYIDLQIDKIFVNSDVELVKLQDHPEYIEFILGIVHDHTADDHEDEPVIQSSPLGYDPHFWISPLRVKQAALFVYLKLVEKYPDYLDTISENYTALDEDLSALSDDFKTVLQAQTIPTLMSTNIYGYLRADYGLSYISISPGYHEEPEQFTSQEKDLIVAEAMSHSIRHVIFEKNITSPLSSAVFSSLEELGVNPVKLEYDILQTLTNRDRESGKDYISIMSDNLDLLIQAMDYQEEQET
jgi:zinc transport system substrate-binding protein